MPQRRLCSSLAILAALALGVSVATSSATAQDAQKTSQQDGKKQRWSTLVGAVIDSIHLLPLAGATVLLDGTTISAVTGDDGKFRIDSIPPGDYRLAVFHPLLDTLGFSIGTEPLRMGVDSIRQVIIGTPSSQSMILRACAAPKRRLGPAAIMGRVLDPDTEIPLAGVRVTMVWSKLEIGKDIGVKRIPQLREATTDSSGNFILCGVQPEIIGTIQAERGESKTAEVPVELIEQQLLAFQTLHLIDVPLSDSAPKVGDAVLSGRVINKEGAPIPGATVSVQGAPSSATRTGQDGMFRIIDLPSGTRSVYVKALGFSPRQRAVNLTSATPVSVEITLQDQPASLAAVNVEGKYEAALKKNGFMDRKRMGMGRFLGPKDIERRQPQYLSSLFQTIPGFRVEPGYGGNSIKSTRGSNGCVTLWVDGVQYRENQPGELDNQLMPDQLMAIETYSAVGAPSEYKAAGQTDCSVVVIWTNRTVR